MLRAALPAWRAGGQDTQVLKIVGATERDALDLFRFDRAFRLHRSGR